jgi:hypothetical protein
MKPMLDRRAWIISSLLVLLAAGAYVLWITRPRAKYEARSLTAAGQPARQASTIATKSLHVEGCNKDFIVKPGELVEPRAIPGTPPEQLRSLYGKETKRGGAETLVWDRDPYSLTERYVGPERPENFIQLSLNQGHVVETLDGVELGIDSFGAIFRQMRRDRKIEIHETIEHTDNNWTLRVSMFSDCGRKFRSEYSRTIPASPETDRLIAPRPPAPGAQPAATPAPWRSDVFMNKVVYQYALTPSNGHDVPIAGDPSDHE